MDSKTVSKSFRLPAVDAVWLQNLAKQSGSTQTEVLSKCIATARMNEGKEIAIQSMGNGGITEDNEAVEFLGQLGIATVSGFAGYHIAGFIRKQLDMDEDKGTQILIGMLSGLAPLIIQAMRSNK
jgi:hypothetical protein